jgi:hypothetical protein
MKDEDNMLWSRFQNNRSEVMVIIETLKREGSITSDTAGYIKEKICELDYGFRTAYNNCYEE